MYKVLIFHVGSLRQAVREQNPLQEMAIHRREMIAYRKEMITDRREVVTL